MTSFHAFAAPLMFLLLGSESDRVDVPPSPTPSMTLERCAVEVPEQAAKFQRLESEAQRLKAAYDKQPTPENEAAVLAAVDAMTEQLMARAPLEYQCEQLQRASQVEAAKRAVD
ncbi:hypothetical protein [Montanilutibacter psychrotolerans]|uniref:Uncharacterized protein n=1 Tax=Montanilutibacter psychrotolerans TaxID=1327343 RepID=A0A3M8SWM9_9GAMM|nr:hypothetical protein [Lysobacter psychrotolerans]RNF85095.1 hypothetical protein EER27_04745 [Lysobacter psychrotolerans]